MGRTWGYGDMGFRGHGTIRSPIYKTNTPFGLDLGRWGLGDMVHEDMGTWGLGGVRGCMGTRDMGKSHCHD